MIEQLKKYFSAISLMVPVIYVIGFVIVNSFLSGYSVYDVEVLSLNYLKSGIFFSGIFGLAITCVYASFGKPTDNLQKSYHQFFILFHNCLLVCSALAIILFRPLLKIETPLIQKAIFFVMGLVSLNVYFLLRIFIRNSSNERKKRIIFVNSIHIGLLLVFLISVWQITPTLKWFVIFFISTALFLSINLGEYHDGKYNLLNFPLNLVGILLSAVFFGRMIFGDLPSYAGGSKLQTKAIYFRDSLTINSRKLLEVSNKEIIYVGSNNYFISFDDTTLMQVKSDNISNVIYVKLK